MRPLRVGAKRKAAVVGRRQLYEAWWQPRPGEAPRCIGVYGTRRAAQSRVASRRGELPEQRLWVEPVLMLAAHPVARQQDNLAQARAEALVDELRQHGVSWRSIRRALAQALCGVAERAR